MSSDSKQRQVRVIVLCLILFGAAVVFLFGNEIKMAVYDWFGGERADLVDVNRAVKFSVTDKFAGNASSGTLYVYDGVTQKDSGALSSGTKTTQYSYASGKELNVKVINSNSKQWFKVTVPKMLESDKEAITTNPIPLEFFTVATITDGMIDNGGTTYSDGATYNKTATGNTRTFTYNMYVGTDNTGFISSYDPINKLNWQAVVYAVFSGANYEHITVTGFDGGYEKGSSYYCYKILADNEITKHKVGNKYVAGYEGAGAITFSLDLTGYSGDAASMQLYLKIYSDPTYYRNTGSYGPDNVELAETTLLLKD